MPVTSVRLFSESQVEEIKKLLDTSTVAMLSRVRLPGASHNGVSLDDFVHALFARSSPDVAQRTSSSTVAKIVTGAFTALSTLAGEESRIVTYVAPSLKHAMFIATDDRPFIVSTIAERLSDAGVSVAAFLHPVIVLDGKVTAFSYVELDEESVASEKLIHSLRSSLIALLQVVNDFDAMSGEIRDWSRTFVSDQYLSEFGPIDPAEVRCFLEWLCDGTFFLLATRTLSNCSPSDTDMSQGLGLWKVPRELTEALRAEAFEDVESLFQGTLNLSIRKLRSSSMVHRAATLLHILVRVPSSGTALSLLGYLTSKAWTCECQDIPVLRQKVSQMLREEAVIPNSHDYKYMVEIVDNMPTDEALCCSAEQLRMIIQLSLGVFSREVTRSRTYVDPQSRRALTMLVLPPERYSAATRHVIQETIETFFAANRNSSEVHLDSSKRRQYRLYVSTPLPLTSSHPYSLDDLSTALGVTTLTWDERLFNELEKDTLDPGELLSPSSFTADYRAAVSVEDAYSDVQVIVRQLAETQIAVSFAERTKRSPDPVLSIFSVSRELSISGAVPILENIGLEVLRARSYSITIRDRVVQVLKLTVRTYDGSTIDSVSFSQRLGPGITAILNGEAQNDALNSLLRSASLTVREISLLRTYCALLWQVNKISTKRTMWEALAHAPQAALQLWKIFSARFDVTESMHDAARAVAVSTAEAQLVDELRRLPDITQDRILKALLSLIRATVRTNFYSSSDTIVVKVRSGEVEVMPHPRPLFELFVFSPRIEGTHLRGAKVARGGIRWSERLDDYRSEVLGLMKTQRVKNVIIVPSGAKGGFIVKNAHKENAPAPQQVEGAYKEYIRALLSVADNQVDGAIIHPKNMVVYDDPDPYFVVAADKGTATFSDLANSIAQNDFQFWLEDAFASGGSAGYDHKKYGITAKGGWECVVRHFRDLGLDYNSKAFTVVGIGDMSGDVFGNGLLLSERMALVAAFNHKHIFIDPSPPLPASFNERKRLFSLPRSSWTDYDHSLISEGGGVFGRFDKEIALTPQIRSVLGIPAEIANVVDGEYLISLILQAPVDLLWNGGIGTYVKSPAESHSDVNDGTNDRVRVNSSDLRCKVVGEGGNLGFTQRARIDYSRLGGRINTDAIDNSGGVDLSDHEVNLKLLLNPLVRSGRMSRASRDVVLKEVDQDVVDSVLRHNRDQAWMLTVAREHSKRSVEPYRALIRDMHRKGYLDRNRDGLPDEAELDERLMHKTGLYRPELALCGAAAKMWIKDSVRDSALLADDNLEQFLIDYFPPKVVKDFTVDVTSHPLRRDIISSEMVNSLLPAVGLSFVHNLSNLHNNPVPNIIKSIVAADTILCTNVLREALHQGDSSADADKFLQVWQDLGVALCEASTWLLKYHGSSLTLGEMVGLYSSAFDTLVDHVEEVFTGKEFIRFERRVAQYESLGVSRRNAVLLSVYRRILPVLEILWCSQQSKRDERAVAAVFAQVLEDLGINTVLKFEGILEAANKWEQELIMGAYQEIRRSISLITAQILDRGHSKPDDIRELLRSAPEFDAITSTMNELEELGVQKRPFQIAVLPVIARQLRLLRV